VKDLHTAAHPPLPPQLWRVWRGRGRGWGWPCRPQTCQVAVVTATFQKCGRKKIVRAVTNWWPLKWPWVTWRCHDANWAKSSKCVKFFIKKLRQEFEKNHDPSPYIRIQFCCALKSWAAEKFLMGGREWSQNGRGLCKCGRQCVWAPGNTAHFPHTTVHWPHTTISLAPHYNLTGPTLQIKYL